MLFEPSTFKKPYKSAYTPLSEKERIEKEQAKKDSVAELTGIIQSANECLKNENFKKYKKDYLVYERKIVDSLIGKSYVDPVQDAFFMREQLARLSILKQFITDIEQDAERKI